MSGDKRQQALDKKAENARELGLDYEPAKQEPVAWVCYGSSDGEMHDIDFEQKDVDALPVGTMLYTFPPQRTWVGLTDEELREFDVDPIEAKLMIAKLKEKNT